MGGSRSMDSLQFGICGLLLVAGMIGLAVFQSIKKTSTKESDHHDVIFRDEITVTHEPQEVVSITVTASLSEAARAETKAGDAVAAPLAQVALDAVSTP